MERRFAIVVVFEALRARVKRLCSPARPGIRDIARPRARTRKGAHPCPPRYAASRPERASSRLSERGPAPPRSEEHTSELQSRLHLVCRLLLEKKKKQYTEATTIVRIRSCATIIANYTLTLRVR